MKKIIALILAIASMASMLVMPAFAEEAASSLSQDQETLLAYVGVYDAQKDLNKKLTKGEFAGLLAKVAFGLNQDPQMYATGQKAADVKEDYLYYTEICALLSSGYISTNKFGSFLPDTEISINTAYEFILRTMGYSELQDFKDGKYARLAAQKKLSYNLKGTDKGVTYQNACILIYNMLFTDIADIMSDVYDHVPSNEELLYMENTLELFQAKGIVTDDGSTSMYGESSIHEGYISIENDKAMLNKTGLGNLVGKNVVAYFTPSQTEDEYEVVCLYEREDKSTVHVLKSENIIPPYQNNTYSYYDDKFSSKVRKLKVATNATIIYNERALRLGVDTIEAADFIPKDGIVRLYDNNADGVMDVVRIENYQIAVAGVVDKSSGRIDLCFRDTGKVYDLTDISYQIFDANGTQITYDKIGEGHVVSILESFDGKSAKMLVSRENESSTIKTMAPTTSTQRGYITTTDGGTYYVSDYVQEHFGPLEVGASYKFYFDVFGMVAYVEKVAGPNDYLVGYLVWVKRFNDMGGETYLRIYNDSGAVETIPVADKVTVIDQSDVKHSYGPVELVSAFNNNTSGIDNYQGIMRYKINKNDRITTIELPMYYGTRPTVPDRLYCMLDTVTIAPDPAIPNDPRKYAVAGNYYMRHQNNTSLDLGVGASTDKTKVFLVPTDKEDVKEYVIKTPKQVAASGEGTKDPQVKAYATDYRKFKIDYMELPKDGSDKVSSFSLRFVKSVKLTIDKATGEPVYQIDVVNKTATAATFYMKPDLYENGVFSTYGGHATPVRLSPGDGFYYGAMDNYITKAVVAFDADQVCSDSNGNTVDGGVPGIYTTEYWGSRATGAHNNGNPFAMPTETDADSGSKIPVRGDNGLVDAWRSNITGIFVGWVYNLEDGVMTITNQNPANGIDITKTLEDGAVFRTLTRVNTTNLLVRPEMGRVKNFADIAKGALSDIKPYTKYGTNCSRIILVNRGAAIECTFIINKN